MSVAISGMLLCCIILRGVAFSITQQNKITQKQIETKLADLEPPLAFKYLENIKDNCEIDISKLLEKYAKKLKAHEAEKERFEKISAFEHLAYESGIKFIVGIDEAGRGPLAGPVVAAAVILPQNVFIEKLNDSKKLSPKVREKLYTEIHKKAISYGIGIIDENLIDKINILNATKLAMKKAIEVLSVIPDMLFIDALTLNDVNIKQKAIEKGDSLSISIAAASILAKVTRDRIIEEMDEIYPVYGFAKHKGYGTKEHIEAIKKYGPCPIHRKTFIKNFITM